MTALIAADAGETLLQVAADQILPDNISDNGTEKAV